MSVNESVLWGGLSYGHKFNKWMSIGITAFGIYQQIQDTYYYGNTFGAASDIEYFADHNASNIASAFLVGNSHFLGKGWRLGFTCLLPSIHIYGKGDSITKSILVNGKSEPDISNEVYHRWPSNYAVPARFGMGMAHQPNSRWTLAFDAKYYLKVRYKIVNTPTSPEKERDPVFNFNTGYEYLGNGKFPLRFGLYTSLSPAKKVIPNEITTEDHINIFGATVSLGYSTEHSTEHTTTNLGLVGAYGTGQTAAARGIDINGVPFSRVGQATTQIFGVILSSTYRF